MTWYGADPGGIGRFGVARLDSDGSFNTRLVSSVDKAAEFLSKATSIGIDCPLWWSSGEGGGRKVDRLLRSAYGISSGTVQSVNSLRGAVLTQGILLAMKLRANNPGIAISEAHPKALIKALALESWSDLADRFKIIGTKPAEHERDALLGAIVAREAARGEGNWVDLSLDRNSNELNPKTHWFGPVSYWWPEKLELV